MFCERCGTQLAQGHRFCPSCGKAVGMAVVPIERQGKVERHIQVLAILWLLSGALNLLAGFMLFFFSRILFSGIFPVENITALHPLMRVLLSVGGTIIAIKAVLSLAAGWGLLERQSWARPLALVAGFLDLFHIPLGTALGIYTIWVLLPTESGQEYDRLAQAA